MNVMDLMAKISLDSSEYEKGIGNAKSSFSGLGSHIASGAKTIGKAGVAAFAAIGTAIGGATTALISNAKETAAYADNIDKMSQKMGFTTDAFQEWDFIMQHSGSSIEAVKGSLVKLDKALESDSDAWGKLGLSQEELLNMSSEERFEATVKALQGVTDETEKAALAQDVFGKSYQELMPLLNTSAEETENMKKQVHDLGGVMSEDAVKAGAQFQDSLQNLKTSLTGAKNNLMGEFLPSLSTVMDGLSALFSGDESGIGKITQGIEDFASKLNEKLPKVIQTVGSILTSLISALPQAFEAIASQLPSILEQAIPVLIDAVVGLADAIVSALPKIMDAIEKNIDKITSGLSKILLSIGQIIIKLLPRLLPMLIKVGLELIKALAKGFIENANEIIKAIFETVNIIIKELTNPETLTQILECGLQILLAIIQGIIENLPLLLEAMFTLLGNIITFLVVDAPPKILETALSLFKNIGQGALDAISDILGNIGSVLTSILGEDGIGGWAADILGLAVGIFKNIGQGLIDAFHAVGDGIWEVIGNVGGWIKDRFYDALDGVKDIGEWICKKIGEGLDFGKKWIVGPIKKLGKWIGESIYDFTHPEFTEEEAKAFNDNSMEVLGMGTEAWKYAGEKSANDYYEGQKKGFSVNSPSRKMRWLGQMIMDGFNLGLEDESDTASKQIFDSVNAGIESINPLVMNSTSGNGGKPSAERKMDQLLELMAEIVNNREGITVPVFVGGRQIDEVFVDSKNRVTVRSGGQVNV